MSEVDDIGTHNFQFTRACKMSIVKYSGYSANSGRRSGTDLDVEENEIGVWAQAQARPKPGLLSPTQARPEVGPSRAQGRVQNFGGPATRAQARVDHSFEVEHQNGICQYIDGILNLIKHNMVSEVWELKKIGPKPGLEPEPDPESTKKKLSKLASTLVGLLVNSGSSRLGTSGLGLLKLVNSDSARTGQGPPSRRQTLQREARASLVGGLVPSKTL
ncbi:hypothetical protein B0H13DRAFT_1899383 [Mycena leptocephala]|nr:hypothetical protein B0H13DRAFT_1899383 [Mycena leptocephala]